MSATLALESVEPTSGPWPRRWALGAALAAVPLVLFGGSVTTLGAGMAVDGWLIAEGHFMLFFPIEKWFRDTGTFVEHTHRWFGTVTGLFILACVVSTWLGEARWSARRSALVALVAVCIQGTLGGVRVLADDPRLAIVHGALAQLVFAILVANVLLVSGEWRAERTRSGAPAERAAFARAARVAWLVTLGQVVLGAWYRHGLRPVPVASEGLRFLLHGLGALLVLASAAAALRRAAPLRTAGPLPASLALALRALPVVLLVQLVLGGLAWAGFRPGALGPAEWALSILHVLGGAVLLSALTLVVLWSARLARPEAAR